MSLTGSLVSGAPRSQADDARALWSGIDPAPKVVGMENIPAEGPVLLIANHYQRRGLWIGYPAALITTAVTRRRGRPPCWLVTGGLRLFQWRNSGPVLPASQWLFDRVAHTYGLVCMPLSDTRRRAGRVRSWMAVLESGGALAVFPEGLGGSSRGLSPPERGFERLSGILLSRYEVGVLPVGIWEDDGVITVRFGELRAAIPGCAEQMQTIAELLPERLRGVYGTDGPLG